MHSNVNQANCLNDILYPIKENMSLLELCEVVFLITSNP